MDIWKILYPELISLFSKALIRGPVEFLIKNIEN